MYGLLFAMGSAFLLIMLAVVCAVAVLLWWLATSKKRELYIGVFAIVFLYTTFTNWHLWSFILAAWTYFITSIALWRAASKDQKLWFAGILVFSIFGIVPAIYVWVVEKLKVSEWYK